MLSRLLGLAREQLFAALFGTTALAEAFLVAFRIPNMLRDLFAEGVFAQAFVPSYKKTIAKHGQARGFEFANRIVGTLLVVIGILLVFGFVFAPTLVDAMAPEFSAIEGKRELTVLLTRIMLPFLLIVSMAAIAMGILNSHEKYTTPALAPAMFNVASISGALLLLGLELGLRQSIIGWAIAALCGGFLQLCIQIPGLWKLGFRLRPKPDPLFRNNDTRTVAKLMGPAAVGLAAMQVNVFVNTVFASQEEGAVAWLNYAFRFLQLPIGIFGVAIATVATTKLAQAAAEGNKQQARDDLQTSLGLVFFLTIPATVGLFVLAEPIIQLIYQRRSFVFSDTLQTAAALRYYMLGLITYAGIKVMAPLFYANDKVRIPMFASILSVVINIIINVTLFPVYGFKMLALGTAVASIVNFATLYFFANNKIVKMPSLELSKSFAKAGVAAAAMGVAAHFLHQELSYAIPGRGILRQVVRVLATIGASIIIYGICAKVLRMQEMTQLTSAVDKRFRKN